MSVCRVAEVATRHTPGCGPALGDGPHDERLAAARVARDEDAGDRAHEVLVATHVGALVEVDAELLDDTRALRAEEAHREEHQLRRDLALGARLRRHLPVDELDLGEAQRGDVAVGVADELGRADGVDALAALLVRARDAVEHRVGRPRLSRGTVVAGLRHDLEARDGRRPLAVRGADAVGAGVTAADDDHVLARGEDLVLDLLTERRPVALRQVLHRLVDVAEVATRDVEVAGNGGAEREHHGVVAVAQLAAGDVDADVHAVAEAGALGLHLGQAPVEDGLLHLELGDAVAQQAAGLVGALEDRHGVAGAGQLLRRGETSGAGTDDRDRLARQALRRQRLDEALVEGALDRRHLDLLDRHGGLVDAQHARRLAGRRAEPARELGEVVRRVQALDRVGPVAPPREVVPLGDEVAQRAARVAEGDAAVHAASGLALELSELLLLVDLLPVPDADRDGAAGRELALAGGEKALGISHGKPP